MKHDVLTRQELDEYRLTPVILQALEEFAASRAPKVSREQINVLDWGCGRGRSVAKLREAGFNAFGVDIDERVMQNGHSLFSQIGLDPRKLLLRIDDLASFPDAYFHCIISEQVLEHVMDIHATFLEMWRLTAPGGSGLHCFPGSGMILEEHINMPLVHWLPKSPIRRAAIALCLVAGFGPERPWPETDGKDFLARIDIYYRYLDKKTCYRDIGQIAAIAMDVGFEVRHQLLASCPSRLEKWLPAFVRRNGFPGSSMLLRLSKPEHCVAY
jgi:SAM-dependent methyltransferase